MLLVTAALVLATVAGAAPAALAIDAEQPGPASGTSSTDPVPGERIGGADRFATAAAVAMEAFDSAEVAHLATGLDFPDALAGAAAAAAARSPLLLTARDRVPAATLGALAELGTAQVVLVGGAAAVSGAVEAQLAERGYAVRRVAGADRYATAAAVALGSGEPGTVQGERTAVLASGEDFADALAVGPVAASLGLPLLLTPATRTSPVVDEALATLGVQRVLVVGGEAAVSAPVAASYVERGLAVERIAGPDRTATAAAIAGAAVERFGFSAAAPLLARGDDYPDALAAGVLGGRLRNPLLLAVAPSSLGTPTGAWLTGACPGVQHVLAVGGNAAINPTTLDDARRLAASCQVEAWTNCASPTSGYSVGYPEAWSTNTAPIDALPPCSLFDPDPAQIRSEGMEVPADVGVFLKVDAAAFEEAIGAGPFEEELTRTEVRVAGRRAERLEVRATGGGFLPAGTLSTRWTVDLGDRVLGAVSHDVGEPAYTEKTRVLDQMVATLRFGG